MAPSHSHHHKLVCPSCGHVNEITTDLSNLGQIECAACHQPVNDRTGVTPADTAPPVAQPA
ncbi:MAG: hypothetical protein AB7L41_01105 [Flavobacteriaceae bacterium]